MSTHKLLADIRAESRAFEKALPARSRKSLGQFYTGTKVSRLLAHLAMAEGTEHILDPMAGTGDLLDAVWETGRQRGTRIRELDAIEIHAESADLCERRLRLVANQDNLRYRVFRADAFAADTYDQLDLPAYDLVIANPPYVRYQSMNGREKPIRAGLADIVARRPESPSKDLWATLATAYSGLADLSVPSWLLCALLVRPGGRLALVSPSTWRSRAYADVVRYLILRAFELEFVIEDSQPGWFPDATVGTHLVVARRLPENETSVLVGNRTTWRSCLWTKVLPEAASPASLVGSVFPKGSPEAAFASWCRHGKGRPAMNGLSSRRISLVREWHSLRSRTRPATWLSAIEPVDHMSASPHVRATSSTTHNGVPAPVPDAVTEVLPAAFVADSLRHMDNVGIKVGQGLRTGCNRFFYVQLVQQLDDGWSMVTTNAAFGPRTLRVPSAVLHTVLHRQVELPAWQVGTTATRLLDLRQWALPEDMPAVKEALPVYRRLGQQPPCQMPDDLAHYVRDAARVPLTGSPGGQLVPALSAVRTNVRPAGRNAPPRFWYMLPTFMPRHQPDAFIPRVLDHAPRTFANPDPDLLIDANFSGIWSHQPEWSPDVLAAFLSSSWSRTMMEATGTRMGGGALKLEAAHLKQLPLPYLPRETLAHLDAVARRRTPSRETVIDWIVLRALLAPGTPESQVVGFRTALEARERELRMARRGSRSRDDGRARKYAFQSPDDCRAPC